MSSVFAALAGLCLVLAGRTGFDWRWSCLLVAAAGGMQLRLLCNLFDGMVAIEGGFKSKAGELYNELPDRFSDVCIFVGAAYSLPAYPWMREWGWAAAVLAVVTAYTRALGAAMGAGQHFLGPMAKQQRMAVMTGACLAGAVAPFWHLAADALPAALVIIAAGCLVTVVRRCRSIAQKVEAG